MTCDRKHILVTVTSSGIGRATVAAALSAGYHVFAGDRSTSPPADGPVVTHLHLDVTDPSDIAAARAAVEEHGAGLDALANVAGVGMAAPLEVVDVERMRGVFQVNVFGQVALTQALIPLLREARGRIVFVGSVGDRTTVPFAGPLTSSKFALAAVAHTWRQELAPWGIKVILVEPASIHTPAVEKMQEDVERTLAGWTPGQAALYADAYRAVLGKFLADELQGSAPEVVAETILTALTASRPRTRYLTGAGARGLATLAQLPQAAQDVAKRKRFGLPDPG